MTDLFVQKLEDEIASYEAMLPDEDDEGKEKLYEMIGICVRHRHEYLQCRKEMQNQ